MINYPTLGWIVPEKLAITDNTAGFQANSVTNNIRGAIFMSVSMAGFSLNDALIKLVCADLPLFQARFVRGLLTVLLMLGVVWYAAPGWPTLGPRDTRWLALRMAGEVGGTLCFLSALIHLPLADATAILQMMPMVMTLAAALLLGEQVGWRRYLAVLVGFAGMLLIVRPGTDGISMYAALALGAVVFFCLRDLATRQISGQLPAVVITLVTSVTITTTGAVLTALTDWQTMRVDQFAGLAVCAVAVAAGYLFGVSAMRCGDVSAVSPFRYAILLWAILLGILFFGEYPDWQMLLGAAILVIAGLYTVHRERQVAKQELVRQG